VVSEGGSSERSPLYRNRDFTLLWSGQVVSVLGSRISLIALPLLTLAITRSPGKAGIVGFAEGLPLLIVGLPAGGLVDQWDRKKTMIICDMGRGLAFGSIAIALWWGHLTFAQILIVAFVEGALFVLFTVSEVAALPQVVSHDQLTAAIAQNEAKERGADLVGLPLGGMLFGVSHALPFLVDALSYSVSVVSLLFVRADFQQERSKTRRRLFREVAEGLMWLWHEPFLRVSSLLVAFGNMVWQGLFLVIIVLARESGNSSTSIGIVFGFAGVGGLLGTLASSWIANRASARAIILAGNIAWALLVPLLVIVPAPTGVALVVGAMALVGPPWNVVVGTYQLTLTPDRLRGRIESAGMVIAWGALPVGSILAGALLEAAGTTLTILVFSVGMAGVAACAIFSPSIRRVSRTGFGG
jgi:predicted MFS family arabinose efflux permease